MQIVEWAFKQQVPPAQKLVLLYLATYANAVGVGFMNRTHLSTCTGYQKRSIQRLLKSLRESGHFSESGPWYLLGTVDAEILEALPDGPLMLGDREMIPAIDAAAVGDIISTHISGATDNMTSQLHAFEARFAQQLERLELFHVEHEPEPPPPDPVIENPLYQELLDLGRKPEYAYAVSKATIDIVEPGDDDLLEISVAPEEPEDSYPDTADGRCTRILDILHGANSGGYRSKKLFDQWHSLEEDENKHTVSGEPDAFLLLYPAIVDAAKANVGKMAISEFLHAGNIAKAEAPWQKELHPVDKEDPALMAEISVMLSELEQANDPRCVVQPRTTEEGDDGVKREETLLGWHRRVTAKHNQMLQLRDMGIL